MRPLQHFTFLFCAFIDLVIAQTLTNITIDDNDSSISYIGTWEPASGHLSSRDYGGSHTVSVDTAGSATFTFTGVAVYYLAPKWPYQVDNYIALDGGTPQLVDMTVPSTPQDPSNGEESVEATVLWSAKGLSNTVHRVVIKVGPSRYAIVDGFIYTTQSDPNTSQQVSTPFASESASSTSSTGPTNSPSPSSGGGPSNTTVIIAVSVSAAVVGVVLLVGLIVFFVRRRKRTEGDTPAYGGGDGAYNVPANNHPNTPHSAAPLNAYMYPSSSNNNIGPGTNDPEMSMANVDPRYSAMAYSEGTGSASMGSLSAQQMAYVGTAPYSQDAYGMYPVANRAIVPPNADAGGAYNSGLPAGAYVHGGTAGGYNATGYDHSGYHPENQPGGFNVAAAYAVAGPTTSADERPNQSSSLASGKARYRRMSKEDPSIGSSTRDQNSGFDSPSLAHPSPPPYAAQPEPSSSPRSISASPPDKKNGFI